MIKITFGCSHTYSARAPQGAEMRRLVAEAKKAGRTSQEIYRAIRANKERHNARYINISEVRLALGLRS